MKCKLSKSTVTRLIQLIKPHQIIYNEKRADRSLDKERRVLWEQISDEMNQTFGLNMETIFWKTKWWGVRGKYILRLQTNKQHRSSIYNELKFLRPHLVDTPTSRNDKVLCETSTASNQINQDNSETLVAFSNQDDSSILIEDSDSESNGQPVNEDGIETNGKYFEISIQDDDDVDIGIGVAEAHVDDPLYDSLDADGDKAFGKLIAGELRKMTPAGQQEFKRNVTRFLYS